MPATLTIDAVRAFLASNDEFDPNDEDGVKEAIRELTGLRRVSTDLVAQSDRLIAEVGDEPEAEEEEESEGRSVVKKSYKRRYRPFKSTCGDELAQLVRAHLEVKTEDGKRIDPDKLRTFAVANDCWRSEYLNLNVGMRRMNVVNRLRAKVAKGHDIVWA